MLLLPTSLHHCDDHHSLITNWSYNGNRNLDTFVGTIVCIPLRVVVNVCPLCGFSQWVDIACDENWVCGGRFVNVHNVAAIKIKGLHFIVSIVTSAWALCAIFMLCNVKEGVKKISRIWSTSKYSTIFFLN